MRAFEALYRQHIERVHALCIRMSADPSAAEELVQRAFVRAWERLASYRGDSAFATWLHRVTVNVVLEDRRAAGRQITRLAEAQAPEPASPTPPHPGVRMDLERAIGTLPVGARRVLVLHDIEGWSHEDIAAALGVSIGTTKSQLHRARQLLREVLR